MLCPRSLAFFFSKSPSSPSFFLRRLPRVLCHVPPTTLLRASTRATSSSASSPPRPPATTSSRPSSSLLAYPWHPLGAAFQAPRARPLHRAHPSQEAASALSVTPHSSYFLKPPQQHHQQQGSYRLPKGSPPSPPRLQRRLLPSSWRGAGGCWAAGVAVVRGTPTPGA